MSEPLLGFHVSISKSIDLAVDRAKEIGCTTFQIFTRNPRGWKYKPLDPENVSLFREKRNKVGFEGVVAHMPYLPNLACPIPSEMKRSRFSLREELERCGLLGLDYLVVHLGSHLGKGSALGARMVAEACDYALKGSESSTSLLLENMAGQRNCVGASFEELKLILDSVKQRGRVGVCFDTCHAFAAGFDMSSQKAVTRTMDLFDEILGIDQILVVHLNDSKNGLGSNLDRHEHIGLGQIGENGFRAFLGYKGIRKLPIVMETPVDDRRSDVENLSVVRRLLGN